MRFWRTDLSDAAFGKITAVYGHIDENGSSVRKRPARKMAITDKMGESSRLSVKMQPFRTRFYGQMLQKNSLFSVNSQHNGQKFTEKSPENADSSVKCVLLTDKTAKMGSLSVNSNEILVKQHCI